MHCSVCGGDLAGKSFACPRSCSKFACSLKCIIHHRRDGCCLAQWSAPSFMEIFAETALTEAVALQKVAVQWPDLFGDFRSVDLKSAGVAAEHFWLCGSNMAWCTNRQVDYPLGVPWVQDISTISEMRESNRRLIVALRRLEQRTLNWGFACIALPRSSWGWEVPLAHRVCNSSAVYFTDVALAFAGNSKSGAHGLPFKLVHNCPYLHVALQPVSSDAEMPWDVFHHIYGQSGGEIII